MYESLHNHTTASDGPLDYLDFLDLAKANNYSIMAFTDHDVVMSPEDLAKVRDYKGPVKWISGVEISSGLPTELGGGPAQMFHILGLFVDPTNVALVEYCQKAVAARLDRLHQIVANLRSIGFDITAEDCLADSGGEAVGRRNISRALARSPRYEEVMERLRKQMADEAKEDPEVAMQYMRLMDGYISDQPYKLFLSNDSYLEDIYVDYTFWTDMDASVKLIRDAGGIAILAHWPTIEDEINLEMLEGMLNDKRLDGVELRASFEDADKDMYEETLTKLVERTGSFGTYGIDGHRLHIIEEFARKPVAEKTIGETKALIERFKPSLEFSNLD